MESVESILSHIDREHPSFEAPCPLCGGTAKFGKSKSGELLAVRHGSCESEAIKAALRAREEGEADDSRPRSERPHNETPAAVNLDGGGRTHVNGNGKPHHDALKAQTAAVKGWIENNPHAAFAAILGADLTHKAGSRELYAHCPFHDDRKESFRVNLEKRTWYCDPCGRGDDVIGLAKEIWGVDFGDACRRLSEIAGINGFHRSNSGQPRGTDEESKPKPEKRVDDRKEVRRLRYEIRDLAGELKATHVRIEYDDGSKNMPWEPAGVKPTELPLYMIQRTSDAQAGDPVILVEGEKCVDVLWERDKLVAVGTSTGAGFNKPIPSDESLKPLLRFRVYLWPDADDVGRDHMQRIGKRLIELGHVDLWKVQWLDAPEHADAADYVGDVGALVLNAEAADPYPDRQVIDAFKAYELMQSEHRDYALEGLIRFGSSGLLTGLMEAGKSTFARNLARAWALGEPFIDRVTQQTNVLVVVSSKEYESWAETVGFWDLRDRIFLAESNSVHFGGPEAASAYIEYRMRQYRCRSLILDTLFDYVGLPASGTANADQNRVVMNEQAPLMDMIRRQSFAMLALGHQPKGEARTPDPRDPQESFAGHTGWSAQHRMRLSMRRKAQGVISFITGRGSPGDKGFEEERLVVYDENTRLLTLGGLFKDHLEELAAPSVVETLKSIGVPCGITKLIEEVGKGEKWVRAGLRGARKHKPEAWVLMKGKGRSTKYVLPGWESQDDMFDKPD